MLSTYLQKVGCQTHHFQADADVHTVLVGDDTDLLILLCYYTEMSAEELIFSALFQNYFSPFRRFRDDCLYFISASKVLMNTIYEK